MKSYFDLAIDGWQIAYDMVIEKLGANLTRAERMFACEQATRLVEVSAQVALGEAPIGEHDEHESDAREDPAPPSGGADHGKGA